MFCAVFSLPIQELIKMRLPGAARVFRLDKKFLSNQCSLPDGIEINCWRLSLLAYYVWGPMGGADAES